MHAQSWLNPDCCQFYCAMFTRMPVRAWDMVCISEISDRLYTFIHTEDADGFDDVAYRLVLCEVGQHTACARP